MASDARKAKAISFTPEVLKVKLRALEQFGVCETRRPRRPNSRSEFAAYSVGQIIWVRERAKVLERFGGVLHDDTIVSVRVEYTLDGERRDLPWPMRLKEPVVGQCIANGVFREGARHFFEVVDVKVERLHAVTEEAAQREGFERRLHFIKAFESIYGEDFTLKDPWVFAYTLKRATP